MPDVVVTVPKYLWLEWLEEGDCVGEPETGETWGFFTSGMRPRIVPGDLVYVVAHGRLRGYAPLTKLQFDQRGEGPAIGDIAFGRQGGAVAVTIPEPIRGFRGWRYRWWQREVEIPFPDWKTAGVPVRVPS